MQEKINKKFDLLNFLVFFYKKRLFPDEVLQDLSLSVIPAIFPS